VVKEKSCTHPRFFWTEWEDLMILDKHHLTLYGIAIGLALILTYAITDSISSKKLLKDEEALAVLKAQSDAKDQQNAQFQQQIIQQVKQLTDQNTQLQAQNQQTQKEKLALQAQLEVQKKTDATLPPTDLAARIQTLAPGGTVTVIADGYKLDQTEAVIVAQALEEPAELRQELDKDETQLKNNISIIANDASILDAEKKSHMSDMSALQAKLDTANGQIKVEHDKIGKGKLKWFGIGYVAGFGSAVLLKSFVTTFKL
jgi:hypothetical protein